MGDDHTAESSTTAHQSEYHFVDVMIPILNPAGVQEIVDYGLYGFAMSRYCGTWAALKCMHETVESTGVIDGNLERVQIVTPDDFTMPEGGLNIRLNDTALRQEARLYDYKRDAMLAFIRANKLNRIITSGGPNAKIGIITTGKSYLDVRQALDELGIDEVACNDLGIRLFKIGCPWPIRRQELHGFRQGPRSHHRGRGEALADRSAGARGALRHRRISRSASARRTSATNGCSRPRARSIRTKSRSPSANACWRASRITTRSRTKVSRLKQAQHALARDPGRGAAHAVFLLRLPAQFVDRGAGRHARLCRHRLPLHGAVDGPLDARLHADGRRGRELDRRGAVLQARACVPESRRRHLQSFRLSRDPRGDRGRHQHHLQDPVQRRGRHDRRAGQ